MAKAIAPKEIPALPKGAIGWSRSTKRVGGMFHAHCYGQSLCGSIILDRHESVDPKGLGDFQYWGVCPRCLRMPA